MLLNRIYVGEEVDQRLRTLKGRTGLTPNLLCRLGFCLSLETPGIPDLALFSDGKTREFNRYTLTGQWDGYFFALLRERLRQDELSIEEELESQFKAHLSRGVMLLYERVKQLEDLGPLVATVQQRAGGSNRER